MKSNYLLKRWSSVPEWLIKCSRMTDQILNEGKQNWLGLNECFELTNPFLYRKLTEMSTEKKGNINDSLWFFPAMQARAEKFFFKYL